MGVISDTHVLVRPEAREALRGSELIIHAGDVGDAEVLERLRAIAPTIAVRGNIDTGVSADTLPVTEVVEVGRVHLMYCTTSRRSISTESRRFRRGDLRPFTSSERRGARTAFCI